MTDSARSGEDDADGLREPVGRGRPLLAPGEPAAFAIGGLLLVACSLGAHAQEVITLPPVLVTGSRLPQTEVPEPPSLVVIPEPAIRARAAPSMPELLRNVSGSVHVDQAGAPGGFSSLYLRGADPSHTAIFFDGVKLNDPTNSRGGGIDLSLIDPRTVSRVEIAPGASSAIYGADAMAGALNIITRPVREAGLRIGTGIGGDGYRTGFVQGGFRTGTIGLRAAAAATDDGPDAGGAYSRLRTALLRAEGGDGTTVAWNVWLRAHHQRSDAFPEDSGGPSFAVRRQLEARETEGIVAAVSGERRTAWGSVRLYVNAFDQHADTTSPGVAPGVRDPFGIPASVSAARYRRWTSGAVATLPAGSAATWVLGAEHQREKGEVASHLFLGTQALPADFALERRTTSVFSEGRTALGDRLTAQAGVRADRIDAYGTRTTAQAGLHWRMGFRAPSLAMTYGTGFKPPSFFALGHPLVGNPELEPETSRTLEIAIVSDSTGSGDGDAPVTWRASVFRSRYGNLVDFEAGPPPRLMNRSQVGIKGYDASITVPVSGRVEVRGTVTGLVFDLPPGTPDLRSRPRFRATASGGFAFTPELKAAVFGSWVGRVLDSSVPTGNTYLSPYLLLNASLNYAHRGVQAVLAIDNLFDREHQQFIGFPGRGRRARVELSFEL